MILIAAMRNSSWLHAMNLNHITLQISITIVHPLIGNNWTSWTTPFKSLQSKVSSINSEYKDHFLSVYNEGFYIIANLTHMPMSRWHKYNGHGTERDVWNTFIKIALSWVARKVTFYIKIYFWKSFVFHNPFDWGKPFEEIG